MGFRIEAFQNRWLAPGGRRVDAIVSIAADAGARPAGELVVGFLLDKSGSMQEGRLPSAIHAASRAVAMLDERTWFFVVAFDGSAHVVVRATLASPDAKRYAAGALAQLQASGGTSMSSGLRAARLIFERFPQAIRRAVFLTDGRNEGERPEVLVDELRRCERAFECDCWGIGTDWHVGEVQAIARALLGKVALVPEPADLEAAFRAAIDRAGGKALRDVRVRLWTPAGAGLAFVKQVSPFLEDLTDRIVSLSPQVREVATGSWSGGEARDFHVCIDVRGGRTGDELLAARPSVVYLEAAPGGWIEREDRPPEGRIFAAWTADTARAAEPDPHVAHYDGQGELAEAALRGLELRERGDEGAAAERLGHAVKLAHASRNAEMTHRLARIVDVVDAANGTVRLKRHVKKAATMELQLESRTTRRIAKPPIEGS